MDSGMWNTALNHTSISSWGWPKLPCPKASEKLPHLAVNCCLTTTAEKWFYQHSPFFDSLCPSFPFKSSSHLLREQCLLPHIQVPSGKEVMVQFSADSAHAAGYSESGSFRCP